MSSTVSVPLWTTSGVMFAFFLTTSLNVSNQLLEVCTVRLIERAICLRQFDDMSLGDIDESLCKTRSVQNSLAFTIGWLKAFDAMPGLLAVLYNTLAKQRGRYFVVALCITGILCAKIILFCICSSNRILPAQFIWLSSLALFCGGGPVVLEAMIAVIAADAVTPVHKTRVILFLSAVHHSARLIFPQIASAAMSYDLLLPFYLSFALLGTCVIAAWTRSMVDSQSSQESARETEGPRNTPASNRDLIVEETAVEPLLGTRPQPPPRYMTLGVLKQGLGFFRTPYTFFILTTVLMKRIAFSGEAFMFQYASEKFGLQLRNTTILRSVNAAGAAFTTLVIWPLAITATFDASLSRCQTETFVIRISLLVATLSFFASWCATSLPYLAAAMLGAGTAEGLHPALQGAAIAFARGEDTAQILAVMATAETVGESSSGPIMSRLSAIGRTANTPSSGVFFLSSSLIFATLLVWSLFIKGR